ncbi:MAG: PIN domain-containing protein [Chakrabartia sp.]
MADANLLSEASKTQRDPSVIEWIETNFHRLYLPTPVLAELRYGCAKLPKSAKRRELENWLADLMIHMEDRILPFDQAAAEAHGKLRALLHSIGKPCSPSDSYIAAMALALDCQLATRNVRDFAWTGVKLVNPWVG